MVQKIPFKRRDDRQLLLLQTQIKLRWLAIAGQSLAVIYVAFSLKFDFPVVLCGSLIGSSVWLNIFLAWRYPASFRLTDNAALSLLGYDVVQLGALLYLTGGLQNPFSLLLIVPVVISAATQSLPRSLLLGLLVMVIASFLVFFHEPLPWRAGVRPAMPFLYVAGTWVAIVSSLLFLALYNFRVAEEARKLAEALAATELVLQREQHLSAIDGLAAAAAHELGTPLATIALVAKEMQHELGTTHALSEDAGLLLSQARRCRDILQKITSLSETGDTHIAQLPLTSLIEEVIAPHREFGVAIKVETHGSKHCEPVFKRNPGILHGLGNLVENAIDFAGVCVVLTADWDGDNITIAITDDGPGFRAEVLRRIGQPYLSARTRQVGAQAGGLGLGLFIAKTLLERSKATVEFSNAKSTDFGARILISWSRETPDLLVS